MAYIPQSGSVVAFQGNPSALQVLIQNPIGINPASVSGTVGASVIGHAPVVIVGGSIATSSTPNQSVSGTVQTDVRGSVATVIIGGSILTTTGNSSVQVLNFPTNQSVSGAVSVSNFPTTQNVSGSVVAFQGTPEWTVKSSISGGIFPISGSVAATITNTNVNVSGSVVAFGFPTNQNVSGSVVAFQGTSPWLTVPTSGSVIANQGGTRITSLVSTVPSSVIVGASIFGQLPGGTAILGSIAALQAGTVPWLQTFSNSSIIAINAGSVITINPGSIITVFQAPSIVGTYAEDAAHTTADRGLFILGVRNDTVASFVSANGEYNAFAHDSAGRVLNKPFAAEEARIEGYNSVVSTSVTTLVPAAGAGLKNYITDIVLINTGATTTLVTFRSGGGTSVLGYGIAPAGGGSNMLGFAMPMRTLANETFDFQVTSASSIIFAKVTGFKAP